MEMGAGALVGCIHKLGLAVTEKTVIAGNSAAQKTAALSTATRGININANSTSRDSGFDATAGRNRRRFAANKRAAATAKRLKRAKIFDVDRDSKALQLRPPERPRNGLQSGPETTPKRFRNDTWSGPAGPPFTSRRRLNETGSCLS